MQNAITITRGGVPYAECRGQNVLESITLDEQSFPSYAATMFLHEFSLRPVRVIPDLEEFRAWKDRIGYACNIACTNKNTGKSFKDIWTPNIEVNRSKPFADAYRLIEVLEGKPLILAVPGPSLKKFAPSLRHCGAPIFAIARGLNVVPFADICISLDAKPIIKEQFKNANCCTASIMDISSHPEVWDMQQRVFAFGGTGIQNDLEIVDVMPCMTVLATAIQLVAVFRCSPLYIVGADIYGQNPERYYEPVRCVDGKIRMAPLDYLHVARFTESVAKGAEIEGLEWRYVTDKGYAWENIQRARTVPKFNMKSYRRDIIDCWRRNLQNGR